MPAITQRDASRWQQCMHPRHAIFARWMCLDTGLRKRVLQPYTDRFRHPALSTVRVPIGRSQNPVQIEVLRFTSLLPSHSARPFIPPNFPVRASARWHRADLRCLDAALAIDQAHGVGQSQISRKHRFRPMQPVCSTQSAERACIRKGTNLASCQQVKMIRTGPLPKAQAFVRCGTCHHFWRGPAGRMHFELQRDTRCCFAISAMTSTVMACCTTANAIS